MDWQEVAIDSEIHAKGITDMYQEFGFEVRLEEVKPDEVEQCTKCLQERGEKIYRIYTRQVKEDDN
jgi:hypothetical protein